MGRKIKVVHKLDLRGSHNTNGVLAEYGMDRFCYDLMFAAQKGLCKICQKPETFRKNLSVDHCHATRKIRGLLCVKCNAALGAFGDDIELLEAAIAYLRANK